VNKTAASATQYSQSVFLLHAYSRTVQLQLPAAQAQQKLHTPYLTSWHNCIIGYKLRTD